MFYDLNFQNSGIAAKSEFFGFEIANILVYKLYGGSIWLKKTISEAETRTYVLSETLIICKNLKQNKRVCTSYVCDECGVTLYIGQC